MQKGIFIAEQILIKLQNHFFCCKTILLHNVFTWFIAKQIYLMKLNIENDFNTLAKTYVSIGSMIADLCKFSKEFCQVFNFVYNKCLLLSVQETYPKQVS